MADDSGLLGPPKTANYRPSYVPGPEWAMNGIGLFNNRVVDDMRRDPQVSLCFGYKKSIVFTAEFEYEANSPEIKRFVEENHQRFWRKGLPIALEKLAYGYTGSESMYRMKDGLYQWDYLKPIYPSDVLPWTVKGQLAYLTVGSGMLSVLGGRPWNANKEKDEEDDDDRAINGSVKLRAATSHKPGKGIWFVHDNIYSQWFGRSCLAPAWTPWRWKTMPDGANEIIAKWYFRHSFSGMEVRYPNVSFQDETTGRIITGQEYARQLATMTKAGASIVLPSDYDENGNLQWEIKQYAKIEGSASNLLEWVNAYLDVQIQRAIDIPDELITHHGSTGGYSRSQVSLTTFLQGSDRLVDAANEEFDDQCMRGLVHLNFGPKARYSIKPKSFIPKEAPPGAPPPAPGGVPPGEANPLAGMFGDDKDKPLQFSASALTAPATVVPMRWGEVVTRQAPHTMIIGPSGSGKSVMAQAIAANLSGKLLVIDPVWRPGNWGGLPAVTVTEDGGYDQIDKALQWVLDEMKRRGAQLQKGVRDFEPITIIWDEVPDTVAELPNAGVVVRRLGQRGRHSNIRLVGIGQSDRVGAWGIEGYGDVPENFAHIYLGDKAADKIPSLAGQERPGVLEWKGKTYPIDLSAVMEMAQKPIPDDHALSPPGIELTGADGGYQMSAGSLIELAFDLSWTPVPIAHRDGSPGVKAVNEHGRALYGRDAERVLAHQADLLRRATLRQKPTPVSKDTLDDLGKHIDAANADRDREYDGGWPTGDYKEPLAATAPGGRKPLEETGPHQALEETGENAKPEVPDDAPTPEDLAFELESDAADDISTDQELSPETQAAFDRDFDALMRGERPEEKTYFAPRGGAKIKGQMYEAGTEIPADVVAKIPLKKRNQLDTKSEPVTFNDVAKRVGGSAFKAGAHALHGLNKVAKQGLRIVKGDESLTHAAHRAKQKVQVRFGRLEQRYGKAAAYAMAGAYVGSWVLWGTNPALAAVVAPEPMAQLIGIAEGIKRAKNYIAPTPVELSQFAAWLKEKREAERGK